jgi:hypothetical protein
MKTVSKLVILAGVVAIALSGLIVNAQNTNSKINPAELPAAAHAFIKEHFSGQTVANVKVDKDFTNTEYDVVLSGGTEIEFNGKGEWKDIDGNTTAIPSAIVPKAITDYVAQHYAGQQVVQIEKERSGFDVELSNGTDLDFDANGKFLRVDL